MSDGNVALNKGGEGGTHSFNCPPRMAGMRLADALANK